VATGAARSSRSSRRIRNRNREAPGGDQVAVWPGPWDPDSPAQSGMDFTHPSESVPLPLVKSRVDVMA
jgi:hypothetical protein